MVKAVLHIVNGSHEPGVLISDLIINLMNHMVGPVFVRNILVSL